LIEYNDGTWLHIIPPAKIRRTATIQASEYIVTELLHDDQVLHFNHYWRGHFASQNALISKALDYIEKRDFDVHRDILKFHYVDRTRNNEIASRVERIVGADHPITRVFRKGIAVHWGELPRSLRRLMEQAIREKAVALVLATSTLADGVNLPIKTLFVPKLGTSNRQMPMWQFLNLVGRAGRPFFHEEGQVVVASCESGPAKYQTKRITVKRYVESTSEQIEVIVTAAVETAYQLAQARSDGLANSFL
jgi:replicative superfamily II helicase